MNAAPKYDVTIDGLTRAEYLRVEDAILRGGTIRDGIDLSVNITAPEPKAEPILPNMFDRGGVLPVSSSVLGGHVTAEDMGPGQIARVILNGAQVYPPQGSAPAVSPEQEASREDAPASWCPPERTPEYLAALVGDLPRNSMVVVYARHFPWAQDAYQEMVAGIPAELIGRQVHANGNKRTVLLNGTTIVPRPGIAARGVSAHLVIVAERPEAFTQRMAEEVTPMTNSTGGQIVIMGESSAS